MPTQFARLSPSRYLESLDADARALRAAAEGGLNPQVPGCPDWTVADLVAHVSGVYQHKAAAMRSGSEPAEGSWPEDAPDGRDALAWFDESYAALVDELRSRDPSESTWTWWPPEQDVAFWYRRMAQETAVHRWDAQSAYGTAAPIATDVAVDGVDELLGWLEWPWDEHLQEDADGQVVRVTTDDSRWCISLQRTRVLVSADSGPDSDVSATITAEPSTLLLYLWGRIGVDSVGVSGDPTALRLLGERLTMLGG